MALKKGHILEGGLKKGHILEGTGTRVDPKAGGVKKKVTLKKVSESGSDCGLKKKIIYR